jgi:signal transduction histidine kinase
MANVDQELAAIHRAIAVARRPLAVLDRIVDAATELTGARLGVLALVDPAEPDAGATVRRSAGVTLRHFQGFSAPLDHRFRAKLEQRLGLNRSERLSTFAVRVSGRLRGSLGIVCKGPVNGAASVARALAGSAGLCLEVSDCREDHLGRLQGQDDAQAQLRLRDDFVAIASHELRNPIGAMRLQLQAIGRALPQVKDAQLRARLEQGVARSVRQCDHLVRISDTLLDTAQLASGRLNLQLDRVCLSELVSAVVSRLEGELRHVGCAPCLRLQPEVWATVDPVRLTLVVTNLLANAIKYAPGAPLEIVLRADDGCAYLSVTDGGPGLGPGDADRIFQRFQRGAVELGVGGWGVGLFLCRQIVEAHGGSIRASNPPGQGARFDIELPLLRAQARERPFDDR